MIQIASYDIETVHSAMEAPIRGKRVPLPDGQEFSRSSHRLVLFKTKGVNCVTCGIEGVVYILETHSLSVPPHLNLYARNAQGKLILMTKDHIQPKSKGGANSLENYATMCTKCNCDKADKVPAAIAS